jgi:hypothetical protein
VSGSHDCSLRVWSLEGDVLAELLGHTAIIYHVAATGNGTIASGGWGVGGCGRGPICSSCASACGDMAHCARPNVLWHRSSPRGSFDSEFSRQ